VSERLRTKHAEPNHRESDEITPAMAAAASMARGRLRFGSTVSPTWQAAASKAGAANPIR